MYFRFSPTLPKVELKKFEKKLGLIYYRIFSFIIIILENYENFFAYLFFMVI